MLIAQWERGRELAAAAAADKLNFGKLELADGLVGASKNLKLRPTFGFLARAPSTSRAVGRFNLCRRPNQLEARN